MPEYMSCPHCGMDIKLCPESRQHKMRHIRADLQAVVVHYLTAKGWTKTRFSKDRSAWGRWMIEADKLLNATSGDVDRAKLAIDLIVGKYDGRLEWVLATVARRAPDVLAEHEAVQRARIINMPKPWACAVCGKDAPDVRRGPDLCDWCQGCLDADAAWIAAGGLRRSAGETKKA